MHLADQGRDIASGYGVVADISGYDFRSLCGLRWPLCRSSKPPRDGAVAEPGGQQTGHEEDIASVDPRS
jgi:hypothetical protein